MKLFPIQRRLGRALAGLGLSLAGLAAAGPYLCTLGPAPLRWQQMRPASPAAVLVLPPLPLGEPDPATSASEPLPAATSSSNTQPAAAAVPEVQGPVPPTPQEVLGTTDTVAPLQSLMPFFYTRLGTNQAVGAMVPLDFRPPQMPMPRSSSATYSTAKP